LAPRGSAAGVGDEILEHRLEAMGGDLDAPLVRQEGSAPQLGEAEEQSPERQHVQRRRLEPPHSHLRATAFVAAGSYQIGEVQARSWITGCTKVSVVWFEQHMAPCSALAFCAALPFCSAVSWL